MRPPGFLLRVAVLAVSAAVAATVVLVLGSRPDLEEAEARVEETWSALRPVLEERYAALAAAAGAARDELGGDTALLGEVDAAVAAWRATAGGPVETQVAASNHLEGLAARLSALVAATARLRSSDEVADALVAMAATAGTAAGGQQAYNEAVRAYEGVRGGFPRRLVAGALGFDSRRTLELPA